MRSLGTRTKVKQDPQEIRNTIGRLSTGRAETSVQKAVSPALAVVAILTPPTTGSAGCDRPAHGTLQA